MTTRQLLRSRVRTNVMYAGFVSRFVAFLIDLALVVVVITITGAVATWLDNIIGLGKATKVFLAVTTLIFDVAFCLAVYVVCTAAAGQTPGKWLMGLRVVMVNGQPLTVRRSLRRLVGQLLSLPLFWGYLIVLIDDRRRSFADKFAATQVIYDRQ